MPVSRPRRGGSPASRQPKTVNCLRHPVPPSANRRVSMKVLRQLPTNVLEPPGLRLSPHYVSPTGDGDGSLRIHHIDEGPPMPVRQFCCCNGEAVWCFLYRKNDPPAHGGRFPGGGPRPSRLRRLGQAADRADYTYARHVEWLRAALLRRPGGCRRSPWWARTGAACPRPAAPWPDAP